MQILDYLEAYTEHFGFREHITFRTEVVSILPSLKDLCTVITKVEFRSSAPPSNNTAPLIFTAACEAHLIDPSVPFIWTRQGCTVLDVRTSAASLEVALNASE